MKRRSLLLGGAGVALAAGAGVLAIKPVDRGANHNPYFSTLNTLLKRDGPGRPVMLIDLERMNHNIDQIVKAVGADKTFRIVVKSLPAIGLLRHVMARAKTQALMVFHQPFLNAIADAFPDADVLMGKPMPVSAVERFYQTFDERSDTNAFDPSSQIQWLIDSEQRLQQYQALAQRRGIKLRINVELDVGLHRGGLAVASELTPLLDTVDADPAHLVFAGFMGYEPHLTGLQAKLQDSAVQGVLATYRSFVDLAKSRGIDVDSLTLNGAGSHTLGIYAQDTLMNDLSAGSGIVKPIDFDTYHLNANLAALFIATPILKRYEELKIPGDPAIAKLLPLWNPNMQRLYYIYGGYWKAKMVSPAGVADPIYQSTNQSPVTTSNTVDLQVDDYMFLRPTQSEHVMLQFGDLLVVSSDQIVASWPVFHQRG